MSNPITIRVADLQIQQDRTAFIDLLDHYSRDPFGSDQPLPQSIIETLPGRWQQFPGAFTLIAWRDGQAIGLANCLTSFSTFKARPRVNIHDLVVHADHRGLGLGRKLIEAVCAEAKLREACQVSLEVRADNERARRLYQRCGFKGIESPPIDVTHYFGILHL